MKIKLPITSAFLLFIGFNPFGTSYMSFSQGTWTQKANVGGTATRHAAIGFSIGTKGYIGLGVSASAFGPNDFWEWDQATDVWTQRANFPGGYRFGPVGFSIGTKGYVGTGSDGGSVYYNDFWEWNQSNNTWTQKTPFPGAAREIAVGFSIGTKGYIGVGQDSVTNFPDFWEWNQTTNAWTQKANFGGGYGLGAAGFSIGTKGYIGGGNGISDDLWEWDQTTDVWTQKASFGGGTARILTAGFSIGTKGYIGTGRDFSGNLYKDFWEWNQATDTWTQKVNFGGTARWFGTGFSIGTKGYIGTGADTSAAFILSDFWEYDPNGNGVNEIDLSNLISVYPHPSTGQFTLSSDPSTSLRVTRIDIYNAEGEKVYSSTVNRKQETINRNVPSGIYFLRVSFPSGHIKTGQGSATKKIIIQK